MRHIMSSLASLCELQPVFPKYSHFRIKGSFSWYGLVLLTLHLHFYVSPFFFSILRESTGHLAHLNRFGFRVRFLYFLNTAHD